MSVHRCRALKPFETSLLLLLLFLASTACQTTMGDLTPSDAAIRHHVMDSPGGAAAFQVLATRDWERGAIVLYTYDELAQDLASATQFFGYDLVERGAGGLWRTTSSGASATNMRPAAADWISYRFGGGSSPNLGNFAIAYGQALSLQVAFVEATFDGGQVLRDTARDGVFVIILPRRAALCRLRVLDADEMVLRQVDLAVRGAGGMPGMPAPHCPPSTD